MFLARTRSEISGSGGQITGSATSPGGGAVAGG